MIVQMTKETCTCCGHYSWPVYNDLFEGWQCSACDNPTMSDEELAELLEIIEEEEMDAIFEPLESGSVHYLTFNINP